MKRRVVGVLVVCCSLLVAPGCEGLKVRMAMVRGNKAYKAQKYDDAIKEYKAILAMDPNNVMANYLIAISNLAQYHPGSQHPKDKAYADESIKYFEKTMQLPAHGETAEQKKEWADKLQKYYLSLLTSAGREETAVAFLESQRQKNPNDVVVIQQLAAQYAKSDFPKALEAFTKVAELQPTKEHWYTVGVVCWERSYKGGIAVSDEERKKLIATGQEALKKALAQDPEYFEALSYVNLLWREQAKVYANEGNREGFDMAMKTADETVQKALAARKKKQAADAAKS
jgi:tetratricopeptide (TPR) repeat protein